MDVTLFSITLTCTICIAFNMFVVELNDSLNIEMMVAFADFAAVIAITAVYFFHSEWITADLLEISDNFYNSPWYRLPVKQQKYLMLPIQRADRIYRMKSLGLFDCSLPVFVSVHFYCSILMLFILENYTFCIVSLPHFLIILQIIRSAASYFIIIRSFK